MEPATAQDGGLKPLAEATITPVPLKPRTAVMEAVEDIVYGSVSGHTATSTSLTYLA